MLAEPPTDCPFCEFEPEVPTSDPKTAPEMEIHRVYIHVGTEHQDRLDELPPHVAEE